ncbi:MAG: CehA/McbA family metallohydrolase [Actinobacteria bacterium]|nr:CehA/McbA family metallohydrolase [Actinomycetota bacterium]
MKEIIYKIGKPKEDGNLLLYGFSVPNIYTLDERELTEIDYRWVEKIAAIKAPKQSEGCVGVTFKISSPKYQEVIIYKGNSNNIEIGRIAISGKKEWETIYLKFQNKISFENNEIIKFIAKKQYLGFWRQNCYRLSDIIFHYEYEIISNKNNQLRKKSNYRLLLGDLHVHTNASLCSREEDFGSFEDNIEKAKRNNLDFISFTDHPEHFLHFDVLKDFFKVYNDYKKKPFIVIPGFEWASKTFGNYNVYFNDIPNPSIFKHTYEQKANSLKKLWEICENSGTKFITVPHHLYHPYIILNTSYKIPVKYQTVVEIISCWGSSESFSQGNLNTNFPVKDPYKINPGFFVEDILRRGQKLGFVGGTDCHNFWPGSAGLTGVYTKDFTLKAIFNAIKSRKTYATTGVKLRLKVMMNNQLMGHIFKVNQYSINQLYPLQFKIDVKGTSNIKKVEIISNGYVIKEIKFRNRTINKNIELEIKRGTYELTDADRYYYVKVYQEKGNEYFSDKGIAWSSPIWIDYDFNESPVGEIFEDKEFIDMENYKFNPFFNIPRKLKGPKRKELMRL